MSHSLTLHEGFLRCHMHAQIARQLQHPAGLKHAKCLALNYHQVLYCQGCGGRCPSSELFPLDMSSLQGLGTAWHPLCICTAQGAALAAQRSRVAHVHEVEHRSHSFFRQEKSLTAAGSLL